MLVIRKLDKYNFVLSSKLKEPKIVSFNGVEVTCEYKNKELFYGNMYEAIKGMFRHNGFEAIDIDVKYKKIKPSSDSELYMPFLEVGNEQIKEIITK